MVATTKPNYRRFQARQNENNRHYVVFITQSKSIVGKRTSTITDRAFVVECTDAVQSKRIEDSLNAVLIAEGVFV